MSARRSKSLTKARFPRGKRLIEKLETRLLFNTIITDTNPLTPTPATQTLEYKDAHGVTVRIVVHGDVSAEFIFGRETKGDEKTGAGGNQLILGDAVGPTSVDDKGKTIATPEDGRDLFHVYIAQASIDSYISIAEVPVFSAKARPMTPFTGSVSLVVTPNRGTDVTKTTDGGTGNIYLGARTRDTAAVIDNEADNPVRKAVFNGQGLLAATPNHRLVAGISTAPDVSIGRFLFGGTVSGEVRFLGSVETFYCGALLTGVTEGQPEGSPEDPGNFYVQGDIRNILVKGSIGTDSVPSASPDRTAPTYWTGTDFAVHGRVGQIKTGDDYLGTGIVYNDNAGLGLRTRQQEIEVRVADGLNRGDFTEFENGQFGDREDFFNNDTFETAQFLGSINSKQTGNDSVQVNGLFQWLPKVQDSADYYAVALMAGQSIGVRLLAPDVSTSIIVNGQIVTTQELKSVLHVGVFDPDDRLIASDYSNVSDTTSQSQDADPAQQNFFSFVADKPGIYRFAVGKDAPGFGANPGLRLGLEQPYNLQLTGVGNLGLGGLVAAQTIYASGAFGRTINGSGQVTFGDETASIAVIHGDLGAIYTISDFIVSSEGFVGKAVGGDFRAIDTVSMGQFVGSAFGDGPLIESITGSIGMIRTRGTDKAADITLFNDIASSTTGSVQTDFVQPIGGDVQYIVAPNTLGTDLAVNGSVGVVQVDQWGFLNYAGSLSVNADGKGKPGVIDLIDVTGDLGTLNAGGPLISTNSGGNVRYIHLSDTSTAYRPRDFGGSQPEQTTYVQGQSADITDDSGGLVHITPTQQDEIDPLTGLPLLDPVTLLPVSNSGTLTVLTYPIARSLDNTGGGGGGSVIIRVDSTRGMTISTNGGSSEIGTLNSTGSGASLILDPGPDGVPNTGDEDLGPDGIANSGDEPFVLDPNNQNDNSIRLQGSRTDIYSIEGNGFNEIVNNTPGGEIVNTNVGAVGTLEADNLGFAKSSIRPGMATEQATVADNPGTSEVEGDTFPFLHAKNAIVIRGTSETAPAVVDLLARQSLGNVMILGKAEHISANADNIGVKGVFEGIIGAVFAKGELRNVQIGEGLLPSGTGNMGKAGIYCTSAINGTVGSINYNGRIDNVINQGAGSDLRGDVVSNSGIGKISLRNGSIINADIEVITSGAAGTAATGSGADLTPSTEFGGTATIVTTGFVNSVSTTGYGGMIGMLIRSASIGTVSSTGGFGLINSRFSVLGDGRFGAVTADGYGIRGCVWNGGQSLDSVTVIGNGHRLTTTSFEPSLLLSGTLAVDPFFGTKPNPLTDLFVVTGTTPAMPQRKGTSASGSFDLSTIRVSRDVGFIKANTIRACLFNVANNLGSISTDDYVDSMILTVGRIDTLAIGKDALRDDMEVAGPVGNVTIGGSFRGSSHLAASGPNGQITSFSTKNSLYGNVSASQKIGTIKVGTTYGSQGTHSGGNLDVFSVNGDFASGAILDVNKVLGKDTIGGDFQDGATIRAGIFGTLDIAGRDLGDRIVKTA